MARRWGNGGAALPVPPPPPMSFYGQQQQQEVPWGGNDLMWLQDEWGGASYGHAQWPGGQSCYEANPNAQWPGGQSCYEAPGYYPALQQANRQIGSPSGLPVGQADVGQLASYGARGRWHGQNGMPPRSMGGRAHGGGAVGSTAPIPPPPPLNLATGQAQDRPVCKFAQGGCNFGDRCKFYHYPPAQDPRSGGGAWQSGGAVGSSAGWGPGERGAVATSGTQGGGGGRGVGGRGGKGKSKGGWGNGLPREVRISKTLTQILRHKAPDLGIRIDPSGFCKTEDVLASSWLTQLDCKMEDVEKVVKESDKQRFEIRMNGGHHEIRAVQGHSIDAVEDEALLTKLSEDDPDLPERCVHGTYRRHLTAIMEVGLKPGGAEGACFRKHVHFSPFAPGDKKVISGMRYDAEVAIWVDMKRAMEAGVPFFISPNKVILSPGRPSDGLIPCSVFEKVTEVKTGEVILKTPASSQHVQVTEVKTDEVISKTPAKMAKG